MSEKKSRPGLIEKICQKLGIISDLSGDSPSLSPLQEGGNLTDYPPPKEWDHWTEYDASSWPERKEKHYSIVPTICFNCEAGCGLLAYVDKDTKEVRKFEGNPYHPGSRGKNCAKGPATINQIKDSDRILYPLKREGKRGEGKWKRVSWEEALKDIGGQIRKCLKEGRNNEIAYHVGRPGHEGYANRVLQAWGIDGHNSHTNVCSSGARTGYAMWHGSDRPSPDYGEAEFMLLISAHLESGHYFNPHSQRIVEALNKGAKMAVMDPRLSNTASRADYWMPTYPGSEAAVLLAMAKIILEEELYDREFLHNWVNWKTYLEKMHSEVEVTFENFIEKMIEEYKDFTPQFAEGESGVPAETIVEVAREIGRAGSRFATHNWRSAGSGNLGGWQVARCLHFLNVLTASVGTEGGTSPNNWHKFKPQLVSPPPAQKFWNELHFPLEYPLAHYEMSFLLPHFLKEGRGRLEVYFTRVFNPVWTYPDGFSWIEALRDEEKIGLHVALTPTWNETAYFADYVLPMGHSSERHDLVSYETHAGTWIGFRQPVLREAARREGKEVEFTYEVNPGQVWEEDEFWIELSWEIDKEGELGIRDHFLSPYREGEKIAIDEYYQYIFERVEGLPEAAEKEGLSPLEYMKKYSAFEVEKKAYEKHLEKVDKEKKKGGQVDGEGTLIKDGQAIGVEINGEVYAGFNSPSKKQEFYSSTLVDWGWEEYALPTYIKSHVHPHQIDSKKGEFLLLPTFRLPTHIHSRSANSKWLSEISHRNPLWIHPQDAAKMGLGRGDLIRVNTEIGYFVIVAWITEGIKPGIVACSHHLGRWRRKVDQKANRWASRLVDIQEGERGKWKLIPAGEVAPFKSEDGDSSRIFWQDGGVHQNIAFPVHPDPISGMHCWHQKVRLEKAHEGDIYGEVSVDTEKSFAVYKKWLEKTRPGPGPGGLRRPLWLKRPLAPIEEAYYVEKEEAPEGDSDA